MEERRALLTKVHNDKCFRGQCTVQECHDTATEVTHESFLGPTRVRVSKSWCDSSRVIRRFGKVESGRILKAMGRVGSGQAIK